MFDPWIIIANWNGRSWLEESLATLLATGPSANRVVVVDNGSTDGTSAWLRATYPELHIVALTTNVGFALATNLGMDYARRRSATSYLLLNNDTRFRPGWWRSLLSAAEATPKMGILGVHQTDFAGRVSARTQVELSKRHSGEVWETDWCEGSCLWIRGDVVERIGYLDPIFSPAYFEELDYCRRARRAGFAVGFLRGVSIEHHGAATVSAGRSATIERGYLLYHASSCEGGSPARRLADRIVRHTIRSVATGRLAFADGWRAAWQAWQMRQGLRVKRGRDRAGGACPVLGTSLPTTAALQHSAETLEQMKRREPRMLATSGLAASVVIPVRERTDDLERCLACVLTQEMDGDFEVLVCDDGSSALAGSRIAAMCQRDRRVRYVRQQPMGPAAARNLGVREARAPIIVFTDSDTLPQPGWLREMLRPFVDEEVVGVEGPVRTPGPAMSPLEEAPRNEGGVHLTANMAYRRDVLVAVGGLDQAFPYPAFEDVDLALCAERLGRIVFAAHAVVVHPWRRVTLASSLRRLRQMDWLIVTASRHGCLGWKDRPTKHPRWSVIRAALLTLPAGRIGKAIRFLPLSPRDSLVRIGLSLVESLAAWRHVPRWLSLSAAPVRGRYLDGAIR